MSKTSPDPLPPSSPLRVALVGAGRVGTAIGILLRRRGHDIVGVSSRTDSSARRSGELLGAPTFRLDDEGPEADVVLLGVTDDSLDEVVAALGPVARPGLVVWHVIGSLGLSPLEPLTRAGCLGAALHPMQACPSIEQAVINLPGSAWGTTVGPHLTEWAARLVRHDLDGAPVTVPEDRRALWHAASITTSTGLSAVMSVGEAILAEIDVGDPGGVLGPLVEGTLRHVRARGGGSRTVTGPIVRGEADTVTRHVAALKESARDPLLDDYLRVAELVLRRADALGRIAPDAAARMHGLLDASRAHRGEDPP